MSKLKSNKSLSKRILIKKKSIMFGQTSRRHGNMKKSKHFIRNTRKNKKIHPSDFSRLRHQIQVLKNSS